MSNIKPLISIIVPVYNTQMYVNRCIDSIIGQSYKNIEIILIDDGSTDQSGSICDDYAKKHNNIRVYHQNNQGQAFARNYGLDRCKGEYIGFIDSDDYIESDMYEYLYQIITKYKADCGSVESKLTTNDKEKIEKHNEQIYVYDGENIIEHHLYKAATVGDCSVCCCLFKRNTLENIRFPTGIISEDVPLKFAALAKAKRMVYSNIIKYYYYQKGESTTRGAFKERDLTLFKATALLKKMAAPYNKRIKKLVRAKHERGYFSILARIAFYGSDVTDERKNEIIALCQQHLRKNVFFLLQMPMPINRKILMLLFVINYNMTEKIIMLAKKILEAI